MARGRFTAKSHTINKPTFYTMQLNIINSLTLLLSFATSSLASRNTYGLSTNGVGCTAQIATSSVGFNANFYNYVGGDLIDFNNKNFVANDYTTRNIYASATGVTEPNFDLANNQVYNATIYGLPGVSIYSTVLELKGYFTGMYFQFLKLQQDI